MTDQEINIAIAEACRANPIPDGWMVYHPERKTLMLSSWIEEDCKRWMKEHPQFADEGWVIRRQEHWLNYCDDLNAMHEAETWLSGHQWADYFEWLQKHGKATGTRATAKERAEGFLRAKGLWKP